MKVNGLDAGDRHLQALRRLTGDAPRDHATHRGRQGDTAAIITERHQNVGLRLMQMRVVVGRHRELTVPAVGPGDVTQGGPEFHRVLLQVAEAFRAAHVTQAAASSDQQAVADIQAVIDGDGAELIENAAFGHDLSRKPDPAKAPSLLCRTRPERPFA